MNDNSSTARLHKFEPTQFVDIFRFVDMSMRVGPLQILGTAFLAAVIGQIQKQCLNHFGSSFSHTATTLVLSFCYAQKNFMFFLHYCFTVNQTECSQSSEVFKLHQRTKHCISPKKSFRHFSPRIQRAPARLTP